MKTADAYTNEIVTWCNTIDPVELRRAVAVIMLESYRAGMLDAAKKCMCIRENRVGYYLAAESKTAQLP